MTALDDVDLAIIQTLRGNARMPNKRIAELVGIAPSTCIGRIRNLVDRGVIKGFNVELDPRSMGLELQALISVSLKSGARDQLTDFATQVQGLKEVVQFFFLGGNEDYVLHVCVAGTEALREFVLKNLSGNPTVAATRTSIVFDAYRSLN